MHPELPRNLQRWGGPTFAPGDQSPFCASFRSHLSEVNLGDVDIFPRRGARGMLTEVLGAGQRGGKETFEKLFTLTAGT